MSRVVEFGLQWCVVAVTALSECLLVVNTYSNNQLTKRNRTPKTIVVITALKLGFWTHRAGSGKADVIQVYVQCVTSSNSQRVQELQCGIRNL